MILDDDLREINPPAPSASPSAGHIESGLPITKSIRVRSFDPNEWEIFIEEWGVSLNNCYLKVRRFGGSGDYGVDIAGFCTSDGFQGEWDNYQCKRYAHPLRPSEIWVEIGKILHYSFTGKYSPPRKHYFVASQDVGTSLEKLLNNPSQLRDELKTNWNQYCRAGITSINSIELEGEFLNFVDGFNFSVFSSKSHVELVEAHSHTSFHAIRFGGGLPPRPFAQLPPEAPSHNESRYITQLLDAYGDHLNCSIANIDALKPHTKLNKNFQCQRERFYHAESLRNFARDTVPEGTFDELQQEVYYGVVDVVEADYSDGFQRMKATMQQASSISISANPLSGVTKLVDRQGICHQLANQDRLTWVENDE